MNTHSRISVLLLLMVMMALMLRSTAQDDLIPMPTSESTADPLLTLTPDSITLTPPLLQ